MVKFLLSILLLFSFATLTGQQTLPYLESKVNDIYKDIEKDQTENLFKLYSSRIDPSYELINGRGYFPYYFRSELKPMLFLGKNHTSSVTLDGRKFVDLYLDYDTFTEEVIYTDSSRICIYTPLRVALNKDNVDCFEFYDGIDSMIFRYFSKDTDQSFDIKDGYYEVVSERKSKYLIKHNSILKKIPGIDEYIYVRTGYVDVGRGFSKISTRKKFIRIFGNRAGEVRKFIEDSGIKIRKANKQQIMSVLNYYDNLRNPDN